MLQTSFRSIMTLDYELHLPEYLAKCINKSRPQLHCNGQCQLMKKIEEKEKEEKSKNFSIYEYSSLYVHGVYFDFKSVIFSESISVVLLPEENAAYSFNFSSKQFRPPII